MPDENSSLVSAIVTTQESGRTLEACLRSIRAQTYPRIELVVVDNQSRDASLEIAARYADRVATLGPERSAQRNHGASIAAGAYPPLLDSGRVLGPAVLA